MHTGLWIHIRGGWSCARACCIFLKYISHEPIGSNTKIGTDGIEWGKRVNKIILAAHKACPTSPGYIRTYVCNKIYAKPNFVCKPLWD